MDLAMLATALFSILKPFLRGLRERSEHVAEEAGKETADKARGFALRIWDRLHPKIESRPPAAEAVEDVAKAPDDEGAGVALRHQLEKILAEDPALARELSGVVEEAKQAGIVADVVIYGDVKADHGGVAAGRDITGGVHTGRSSEPED